MNKFNVLLVGTHIFQRVEGIPKAKGKVPKPLSRIQINYYKHEVNMTLTNLFVLYKHGLFVWSL